MTDREVSGSGGEAWSSVIAAVRTPLGLFALIALVISVGLTAVATVRDEVSIWAPLAILGLVVVAVFIIVLVKPDALYDPSARRPLVVSVSFPVAPIDVELDSDHCKVTIRDQRGRPRPRVGSNFTFGQGGWVLRLEGLDQTDSVRLELVEFNGRTWRVNPFSPYETSVSAIPVQVDGAVG